MTPTSHLLGTSQGQANLALLVLRLFTGLVLVYGTQDNVFSHEQMVEFRDFLATHGFPVPMLSAYASAYSQFVAGLLMALGLFTRAAALVMVINFIVALAKVHWGLPFSANIAPLAMLFNSACLVVAGAGAFSLDARIGARAAGATATRP